MVPYTPIFIHHYRIIHGKDERELAKMRSEFQKDLTDYAIQQRLEKGVTVKGKKSDILRAARKWQGNMECGPSDTAHGSG
jgi:hypothetical protein